MKAYKVLYISFLALFFVSCTEDLLNPLPKDRLASDLFWKTEGDAIYASNGIYSVLGNQWRYTCMDAYSDISHMILQWRSESEIEKNTFNSSNNVVADEWTYYYTIIQVASTFLDNVDLVASMNEELRGRLKAEAKTLRAFAYINLAMLYGDVPLVKNSLTVDEAKAFSRNPVSEIWDFISQELTSAAADLPTVQQERGRVTKGVALGLKARAMLYAGRYQDAKAAAKSVMDLGVYTIYESYADLFDYAGVGASEIMFARQYAQNLSPHGIFGFYTANSLFTNSCQAVPTKPLVDAYLMKTTGLPIDNPASGFDPRNPYKDRDPRLSHTIYVSGDILPDGKALNTYPGNGSGDDIRSSAENVTSTGWYVKKYVSEADYVNRNNCGVSLIYLRYAEVLLTYAEASVELGESEINQSVLDALNQLRNREDVKMPHVTTTNQTELRKIVRRERMVELALEGHRLYDIRRWHIGEEVIPGTVKGMTYESTPGGALVTVEMSGYVKEFKPDRHYLWPIPFREIDLNPNLKQNLGY
ncbi:membrane protein [Bacteroidia bacterium]|nr:membrane protein [Bacteroidia bacterium]